MYSLMSFLDSAIYRHPGSIRQNVMGFEICLVAHLFNIFNPVTQINKFYFFLPAKVNKIQNVKGSGTSFFFCRIKIKKYNIKPGGAQVNDGYTDQPGSDSVADLNCVGYVVEKETVIIIKG